jgi:hypothetical protein
MLVSCVVLIEAFWPPAGSGAIGTLAKPALVAAGLAGVLDSRRRALRFWLSALPAI